MKVALKDAEEGRDEAQNLHLRLIASNKEMKRLGYLNLEAKKVEKG